MTSGHVVVMIASPLDAELVRTIESVDERLDVRYQPDLLPPLRFPCDHRGIESFRRTPEQEGRWRAMLSEAEVLFGLPGDSAEGLADAVRTNPGLRFIQATAGGAGEQVSAAGLTDQELSRVRISRAGGVHAGPLAEFAIFALLALTKGLPRLLADQAERRWEHYPMAELADATVLLVGLGEIGAEVARLAKAFRMRVIAVNRSGLSSSGDVDEIYSVRYLSDLLPEALGVVITLPLTEQTAGMIDAAAIARIRPDAFLVNIGRGGVVDERALVDALIEGRLGGAVLDVVATEPLPPESALWSLPNVLISPHTAALSVRENERIVELFAENLRRYLANEELLSIIRSE